MADLLSSPQLDLVRLRAALPSNGLGYPLIYEPSIPSTNTLALARIADYQRGLTVLTDAQPAGRGRQGRTWITLPGQQILLSVVLDLPFAPQWCVIAAAVAAIDALVQVGVPRDRLAVKWPNDILIDHHKIAGILIETTTASPNGLVAVVGIGMNVNGSLTPWPEVAARATTLRDALEHDHDLDREAIIIAFLSILGAQYQQLITDPTTTTTDRLWSRWREMLLLAQPVTVHQGDDLIAGIAEDVAPDGALVLRLQDGQRRLITWGDVALG